MKKNNALDSKCPSCGAQIIWDPALEKFSCEYCASKFSMDELLAAQEKEKASENSDELVSFKCSNCGAEIVSDVNTFSTFCVYCGSTAILKDKIKNDEKPDYVIPFKKTSDDAKSAYKELLKGKWLLPGKFRKAEMSEKIKGIYIPFWAYDITADGDINFTGIDIEKWEDDEYEYEKREYYDVIVSGHYEYEKILCDASKFFSDDLMDSISPFKLDELVKYNHAFLSGYLADRYDVSKDESYKIAKERSKNSCIIVAKRKSPHDEEDYEGDSLSFNKKKTYHIYLPVYILNVKCKDKLYTFAMNGQTGKLVGNLPISTIKYVLSILTFFLLIFLVLWFIIYEFGFLNETTYWSISIFDIIVTIIYAFVIRIKYRSVKIDYYALDYLNKDTLKLSKIKDSYIRSSTNRSRKLNSKRD